MERIIIIGAGILGASAAYHLAKEGAEVIIIDRKDKGQATDAAAGIICPWISQRRNKAWYALAKGGASYYPELIRQLEDDGETDTGYRKVGAISLHRDMDKLEKMEDRAIERRKEAPEIGQVTLLDERETSEQLPLLSEGFSSVYVEGAARVDGRALRDALLNAATKHGATVLHGSATLVSEKSEITGVHVDGKSFKAKKVIIAAGAWASELLEPLGLNVQVTGQKAQIIHLHLDGHTTTNWPVVMPPTDQYILPSDNGKIVIGATHEDETNLTSHATAGGIHEVLDKALTVAPGLGEAEFKEIRVGFRPFTPGFLPVIGEVLGHPELLFANGLGASGLTVGPYLGKQLASIALGQQVDIDLSLYVVEKAISM
ncbi:NAD(P)/FAD-dependent oxidoreductase [Sporosarcina highlanderae]|uniref:FAD-binding oxidoreductase n=1 Tax=Sporosarcina highlanderae TaxID=3035916 RepID=A0ABT8JQA5_9BACL|nr:FAD-binding oxidoreductase [Sporosarcina highlanderae]MDN4607341.1 FAD-binding oxidoreductase [Sporosarcina highlanderae]